MVHVNELIGPVHNSHLTAIRRCKQKFNYAYVEGIQPRLPSLPLARGIWIHYCLEAQFLKWGIEDGTLLTEPESINVDGVGEVLIKTHHPEDGPYLIVQHEDGTSEYPMSARGMLDLLRRFVWNRLFPQEQEKYTEDGHGLPDAVDRILTEYFYHYRDKFTNRTFKILLVEVEWLNKHKGVAFEGRADYVIQEDNGLIVCGDWKSTKSPPHAEYKFMESQLHMYPWGMTPMLLELGMDPKYVANIAVEFDYLSTKLPTTPKQNQDGSLSKRKINTTYLTLVNALKEYGMDMSKEEFYEYLNKCEGEFFINKRLPRSKRVIASLLDENVEDTHPIERLVSGDGIATRTVTTNCNWDCDFMDLCKAELHGQDTRYIRKTQYEPRTNSHAGIVETDD